MPSSFKVTVGARTSPLSKAQVEEVLQELHRFHPNIEFLPKWVQTIGDCDKKTSLRTLDKTDFFTKEIDELQLNGQIRIAIHSAKDLADPLAQGLKVIALTKGVDPSDSLVLADGQTLESLPKYATIATSSIRREEAVQALRNDLTFVDIRGTIGERLQKLQNGEVHGVVIAEAALIRLGLTHLNRIRLPGDTVPLQGKLAIVACENDHEMAELFACLNGK